MRATRLTQPYRTGGSRVPSPALDAMRLGRASASPGAALQRRVATARNDARKRSRAVPRASSPLGRKLRAEWPTRTQP